MKMQSTICIEGVNKKLICAQDGIIFSLLFQMVLFYLHFDTAPQSVQIQQLGNSAAADHNIYTAHGSACTQENALYISLAATPQHTPCAQSQVQEHSQRTLDCEPCVSCVSEVQ